MPIHKKAAKKVTKTVLKKTPLKKKVSSKAIKQKLTKASSPLPPAPRVIATREPALSKVTVRTPSQKKFTGKELVVLNKQSTPNQLYKHARNMSMKLASIRDYQNDRNDVNEDVVKKALSEADGLVF